MDPIPSADINTDTIFFVAWFSCYTRFPVTPSKCSTKFLNHVFSHHTLSFGVFPHLNVSLFPPVFVSLPSSKSVQRFAILSEPGLIIGRGGFSNRGLCWSCSRFLTRCKDWAGDFSSLEDDILEFMQKSDNPDAFPTKEELDKAGRADLAEAIVKEGGWLYYGWDLKDESIESVDFEVGSISEIDGNGTRDSGVAASSSSSGSSLVNFSQPAEQA